MMINKEQVNFVCKNMMSKDKRIIGIFCGKRIPEWEKHVGDLVERDDKHGMEGYRPLPKASQVLRFLD